VALLGGQRLSVADGAVDPGQVGGVVEAGLADDVAGELVEVVGVGAVLP